MNRVFDDPDSEIPFLTPPDYRCLIFPSIWDLNEHTAELMFSALRELGESRFFLTVLGRPHKDRRTWSIGLDDVDQYWRASEHTVNVLYSDNGSWGIRFSEFEVAVVGAWGASAISIANHLGDRRSDAEEFASAFAGAGDKSAAVNEVLQFIQPEE
jgi:hypothetical protein